MMHPILNRQGLGRLEVISQNLLRGTEKNLSTLQTGYVCDSWDSNHRTWNTKLARHYFPILVGEAVEKRLIQTPGKPTSLHEKLEIFHG